MEGKSCCSRHRGSLFPSTRRRPRDSLADRPMLDSLVFGREKKSSQSCCAMLLSIRLPACVLIGCPGWDEVHAARHVQSGGLQQNISPTKVEVSVENELI